MQICILRIRENGCARNGNLRLPEWGRKTRDPGKAGKTGRGRWRRCTEAARTLRSGEQMLFSAGHLACSGPAGEEERGSGPMTEPSAALPQDRGRTNECNPSECSGEEPVNVRDSPGFHSGPPENVRRTSRAPADEGKRGLEGVRQARQLNWYTDMEAVAFRRSAPAGRPDCLCGKISGGGRKAMGYWKHAHCFSGYPP